MNNLATRHNVMLIAYWVISAIYIALIPQIGSVPKLYVLKDLPDVVLALLAINTVPGIRGKLLFMAYVLCAVAGLALDLPFEFAFPLGLALFLLGHVVYIITFLRDFQLQSARLWLVVLILGFAFGMATLLTSKVGPLLIPVYCYLVVISLMCISAVMRQSSNNLVVYGALIFLASDSTLAFNKFVAPLTGADYLVMGTYFVAQFLILYGFLTQRHDEVIDG